MSIAGNIIRQIEGLFTNSIKPVLLFAYHALQAIKANESTIEAIVAATSTKLDDAALPVFEKAIEIALKDLRFVTIEADKSFSEMLNDAGAYLDSLDADTRAIQLTSLAVKIAKWYADHTGEKVSVQELITIIPTFYHKQQNQ